MINLDRLKKSFAGVLDALERRVDYSAFYEAEVVMQNEDGSLELKPLVKKLAPLSRVAIRYGVPGVKAKIKKGGLALVGFANQDPKKPFAQIIDDATIESLALFDGNRPAAYMGGSVTVFFPPLIPFSGTVGGLPAVGVLTITSPAPGLITSGNPKVTL
jgi:hypothetical protein